MKVWVVGKNKMPEGHVGSVDDWELQGVFSSEELAVAECRKVGNPRYFVFQPIELDTMLPDEQVLIDCIDPVPEEQE